MGRVVFTTAWDARDNPKKSSLYSRLDKFVSYRCQTETGDCIQVSNVSQFLNKQVGFLARPVPLPPGTAGLTVTVGPKVIFGVQGARLEYRARVTCLRGRAVEL